ncbi:hypothetical protein D9M71_598670 [compost metagenome]
MLGTPQSLRIDKPTQALQGNRITLQRGFDWALILATELVQSPQKTWLNEVEQTPQIDQGVLDGRTGTRHSKSRRNGFDRLSHQCRGVLQLLRFIAHDDRPLLARQGELLIAKCLVRRQDDSGAAHPTWAQQILDAFRFQVGRDFFLLELHRTQG